MSSKNPMTSKRHTVSMYPASSTSCCSIVMFPSSMSPVFSIFKGVQVVSSSQARDSHMSYRMSSLSGTGARRLALKLEGLSGGILWTRVNRAICDTACDTENFTGTRQSPNVKRTFAITEHTFPCLRRWHRGIADGPPINSLDTKYCWGSTSQ